MVLCSYRYTVLIHDGAHSIYIFASCLHTFSFSTHTTFFPSCSHLNLGLPTFNELRGLLQSTFVFIIFDPF